MSNLTRRRFVELGGIGLASLSIGGLVAACSSGSEKGATSTDNVTEGLKLKQVIIAMNTNSEPAAGFDPMVAWGCGEHVHEPLIQSTLVNTTMDMQIVGDLATSFTCSEDGMMWTFALRDDVKFSDGEPLGANDAAFTINTIKESEAAQADLSMIKEASAPNDTTLVLHMTKPFNALLYTLAVVGIVPARRYGSDYGSKPIGSGRYLLEQWDRGQQVILTTNPLYYGEAPNIERVVVVFMEEDAALAAVRAGQVDIAYTSAVFSDQQPSGYHLFSCKTVDSRGISLPSVTPGNTRADGTEHYPSGNEVTADLAIRRAVNYALDRETIISNVLNGHGTAAYSVADAMPWASTDMKIKTDREKAKRLLDGADWQPGADGIRTKGGLRASFTLIYSAGDSVRQALAAEFSNQMKEIGIEVQVEGSSWDNIYPREFSTPVLWGWGSNSPSELYQLNYSSGRGNYACYENPTLDAYYDQALATPEIENSYELWQKAQWDGNEGIAPQGEATWVWLANIDHLYFKRPSLDVAKQKPHPHGHGWSLMNNVDQWSWNA